MNIFVLSENPWLAAQQMCDKHVVKMPLETAQMLSTIHRVLDGHETIRLSKNGRRIKTWAHPTLEHLALSLHDGEPPMHRLGACERSELLVVG